MSDNLIVVKVAKLPKCAYCIEDAKYDARISGTGGRWAYLCQFHFALNNCKLGLGLGQRLEVAEVVNAEK